MSAVIVVPYDATWPERFNAEAARIQQVLGDNCVVIHHIGSTAVPGLAAKPIIDIIPVVNNIGAVDAVTAKMTRLGYAAKGEHGMLFRRFFQKDGYNVHVFENGNPVIERHLLFRDWMRAHDADRDAYAALKQDLALQFPNDISSYVFAKDAFVSGIDAKTGFKGLHCVKALTPREWEFVRAHSPEVAQERSEQAYVVMYEGATIIGYAQLQLQPTGKIEQIVFESDHQNPAKEQALLSMCQRWIKGASA